MPHTFAEDSQEEFVSLVGQYGPFLLGLARKRCRNGGIDPEDLVQDTLERALLHFELLRGWDDATRRAWLCTTLQRRFLDHCRRQRTESHKGVDLELLRAPVLMREPRAWWPWERISEKELNEAIARLRPQLRAAFELHAEGLRYKTIAERLGTTKGTVGFWLHQARRELREWLQPLAAERVEELVT